MPDQDKHFVINDRRKFRIDGELRDSPPETPASPVDAASSGPAGVPTPAKQDTPASGPVPVAGAHANSAHLVTPVPEPADEAVGLAPDPQDEADGPNVPPPPTAEEIEQVRAAYEATAERLDTMMRSQNLGGEYLPPMDFNRLVQSIYMSAMIQLGAGTQQGQQARVDIIGAKQSIDMLSVISEKSSGNLSGEETTLLESALFELRMGFLEITQLLARQAAAKQTAPPASPTGGGKFGANPAGSFTGAGPRIVR